jgi:4Fe-4S ferredoxin
VGAVARELIDKDFIEKRKSGSCVFCALCARICPTGALEVRTAGKAEKDDSYLNVAVQATTVSEKCVHCGLCAEVCPQRCIEIKDGSFQDGSLRVKENLIDLNLRTAAGAGLPWGAIPSRSPFRRIFHDDQVCQACRTCVHTFLLMPFNKEGGREIGEGDPPKGCLHHCGACVQAPGESYFR